MTQNRRNYSALAKRHFVAVLILPFLIAYVYYLPPLPYFLGLIILVGMTALWEFYSMYKVPAALHYSGVLAGGMLLFLMCLHPSLVLPGIFISLFFLLLVRLFSGTAPEGCMSQVGPLTTGLFYIGGFLSFQWFLRIEASGLEYIFLLYAAVWFADSGAFYIGTYMGKNKLYPSISPNKTWEGAYGSLLGGAIGAVMIKTLFHMSGFSLMGAAAIGLVMGAAALLGDLVESMFKRDAGVKDSSVIIPGHGGILDKLDGMLAAGPVLYFIVRYF